DGILTYGLVGRLGTAYGAVGVRALHPSAPSPPGPCFSWSQPHRGTSFAPFGVSVVRGALTPHDQIFGDRSSFRQLTSDFSRGGDRKSTRLNSSHVSISYAVFCL